MARWHGCWLVWMWLLLPGMIWADEPQRVPRASGATDISRADEPLRLTRPGDGAARGSSARNSSPAQSTNWTTTTASLLFVLTLIAGGAYVFRRQGRRFAGILPDEVVQILGRRYLDQRQSIQLIRCGSKILVLSNSTQHGLTTLSEITDPHEVELITEQCLPQSARSSTSDFGKLRTDSLSAKSSSPIPGAHSSSLARHPNSPTAAGGTRG